jgi:hypothetical protein
VTHPSTDRFDDAWLECGHENTLLHRETLATVKIVWG